MKVAVYLDTYRPEDGGAFTMQGDLLGALCRLAAKSRHQFVVVSVPSASIQRQVTAAGMDWLPYSGTTFVEKLKAALVRVFPSMRKSVSVQSDLEIRLVAAGVEFVWFISPRPLDLNIPYLAIVLDLQHRKQPWFPEVGNLTEWETRERRLAPFLRRASRIVAGTQAGKDEITGFYQIPENHIHILPHPTPAYALEAAGSEKALPAGIEPGYLFYPAQFWAHKNHANLLLALKQLKDEGLRIPLVLVGSDYGNKAYIQETITRLGLEDQVNMLGFVDTETILALYQHALALSYVTFFGPENLPPLEAFALGCPVIASEVDGAKEQMGDAAVLVDPADPRSIAEATRKVHADGKLRQQLITRGKQRAANWTADEFVAGVFSILDDFESIRRAWKA